MNSPAPPSSIQSKKPKFACIRCSDQKVKCDKQVPCNACVKRNAQCMYRPPKPSRRKRVVVKTDVVFERLKHYETLLREQGIDPDQTVSTLGAGQDHESNRSETSETVWQLPTPASSVSGPQTIIFSPQLLHGQKGTKLVDNSLWSRVAEEIHDTEDASEEDSYSDASDGGASEDDFAYVLGLKTPTRMSSHPPADRIRYLWQTFLDNVNPMVKLVHVPSLQHAMEKAIANIGHVPKGFEALMFAIYSIAVLSLTENECHETLAGSRAILLSRYVAATKAALIRARFMSSTSIVVLQALIFHILCIRIGHEPRAVWNLTGVAIRVADSMGMRFDGTLLGLSPFDTEIRRRVWWQLRMHDFRAAELSGQPKFRDFELDDTTPKTPANVNDCDLYPGMSQAPTESTKPTEMIWCMFRSELATFATTQKVKMQKQGKSMATSDEYPAMDNLKIKDDFIQRLEDLLETKYLRFCDPTQPLQYLTLLGGRIATNLMRFMAHHPRRWAKLDHVSDSERQLVWGIVMQLLEQYNIMQTSPQLRRFAWNAPYFIQWHAVIHILDTLRAEPLHPDATKAWHLIDSLYESNLDLLLSTNTPIYVAVGNLCLKAYSSRNSAMTEIGASLPDPPLYITTLQEQRTAAKARREAGISRKHGVTCDEMSRTTGSSDTPWTDVNPGLAAALGVAEPQQYVAAAQPINHFQDSGPSRVDAFWLNDSLDGVFASETFDMMNLDADAILAQDDRLNNPNDQVIDWAQWDVWAGNVGPVPLNLSARPG